MRLLHFQLAQQYQVIAIIAIAIIGIVVSSRFHEKLAHSFVLLFRVSLRETKKARARFFHTSAQRWQVHFDPLELSLHFALMIPFVVVVQKHEPLKQKIVEHSSRAKTSYVVPIALIHNHFVPSIQHVGIEETPLRNRQVKIRG